MRKYMIFSLVLAIIWAGSQLAHTLWLGKGEDPSETYLTLQQTPARSLSDPKTNGYFLLLGFTAPITADPFQVGYDIWIEANSDQAYQVFDYQREGRLEARIPNETLPRLYARADAPPVAQLRELADPSAGLLASHGVLVDRYRLWLSSPFDDWGFSQSGAPRLADLYGARRLYLAEGWAQNLPAGLERTARDLAIWRGVLGNAKSLPLKIAAAAIVDEDALLLSDALRQPTVGPEVVRQLEPALRALTPPERSLHWPLQSEFHLAVKHFENLYTPTSNAKQIDSNNALYWIFGLAGMSADALDRAAHPIPTNILAHGPKLKQRTLNIYAAFYAGLIQASEVPKSPLPVLLDLARTTHSEIVDHFVNPIDNIFESEPEPRWQPFFDRIMETDARLRLAGLQVKLKWFAKDSEMAVRVGRAGQQYYDPFTGIPMLWNPANGTLYSIGKDGHDDGGDPQKDITVQPLSAN